MYRVTIYCCDGDSPPNIVYQSLTISNGKWDQIQSDCCPPPCPVCTDGQYRWFRVRVNACAANTECSSNSDVWMKGVTTTTQPSCDPNDNDCFDDDCLETRCAGQISDIIVNRATDCPP